MKPKPITIRLRELRLRRGVTQKNVSTLTGITYSRYMNIENGYRVATPKELRMIARVLRTTPALIIADAVDLVAAS